MADVARKMRVDTRRDSYQPFFDKDWADTELSRAQGTRLYGPVFDVVSSWRATSYSHAAPLALAKCIEASLNEHLRGVEPSVVETCRIVEAKLVDKLRKAQVTVRPRLAAALSVAARELAREAEQAIAVARDAVQVPPQEIWDDLLDQEYVGSLIWDTERNCFSSLYFSYECFLKECVRIIRGETRFRIQGDFPKILRAHFGDEVEKSCWSCDPIKNARNVRNAFAHNGGRLTDNLPKESDQFIVVEGQLQIMAEHTVRLFSLLREQVTRVISTAIAMPAVWTKD